MLGDQRLLDPITRGMSFFLVSQQGAPNPGWALQYTLDLKPAAARTYEPLSLATHTTASNLEHLITFYELTGDTRYLARVPEAHRLARATCSSRSRMPAAEPIPRSSSSQTNRPLYVHRRGSNVVNGEYYVDYDPKKRHRPLLGRRARSTSPALRKSYEDARKADMQALAKNSPLAPARASSSYRASSRSAMRRPRRDRSAIRCADRSTA